MKEFKFFRGYEDSNKINWYIEQVRRLENLNDVEYMRRQLSISMGIPPQYLTNLQ
jgi:hypothetical protein